MGGVFVGLAGTFGVETINAPANTQSETSFGYLMILYLVAGFGAIGFGIYRAWLEFMRPRRR